VVPEATGNGTHGAPVLESMAETLSWFGLSYTTDEFGMLIRPMIFPSCYAGFLKTIEFAVGGFVSKLPGFGNDIAKLGFQTAPGITVGSGLFVHPAGNSSESCET
jgi:hypothetical protein